MMLKKFRCLALVMAIILIVVSSTTFAAKKPIKLVYGNVLATDHFSAKGDLYFKKLVEKNSKGQILVDYFPASQIGGNVEQTQAIRSGAQQMFFGGIGVFSQYWPAINTTELPYLYRDQEHYLKVGRKLASLLDREKMASKCGVRILGVRINAPRQLTTKFPVNKLEDIKGMKMRVSESALNLAFWKALGTVPTVIPAADTYTALATGTVDGQENPFDTIYTMKFYEQVKYCALTAHMRIFFIMLINNDCWNSLTKAQHKIIQDAADKSTKMVNKAALESEDEYKKLLAKAGMKFTNPDTAPFRERAKTVWSQFGDAELIKKIEAIK
jgi:tripartite ATP-independent transporter DctP family solute receptor